MTALSGSKELELGASLQVSNPQSSYWGLGFV